MKKIISVLIAAFMICSLCPVVASAGEPEEGTRIPPEWVITEICPDQTGDGIGGWNTGNDCMEFIEICNASDKTLNLYEYCMVYNGVGRDKENFETLIVESTPIKPGDYLDGSTLEFADNANAPRGDLSNKPVNPDTCEVAPGEVVVLWIVYQEAYYASWNDGKGLSIDDFRTFWHIPEDVKVIAVDGATNAKHGGHDKNFNLKNKDVGTYGIARNSDALNQASNTSGSQGLPGNFWENPDLICWATVDFEDQLIGGSIANQSYAFTWDFGGYAATDMIVTYYCEEGSYVYHPGRCMLLEMYVDEPTPGRLSSIQKMTLGLELSEGETVSYNDLYNYLYVPDVGLGKYEGIIIQDVLYSKDTVFTAHKPGVYTFDYKFANDGKQVRLFGEKYAIELVFDQYVSLSCDITEAAEWDMVTIHYDCLDSSDYRWEGVAVSGGGVDLTLTPSDMNTTDYSFTFTMPAGPVTVTALVSEKQTTTEAVQESIQESVIGAGSEPDSDTGSTTDSSGGCASVVASGAFLLCLIPAVLTLRKKKEC